MTPHEWLPSEYGWPGNDEITAIAKALFEQQSKSWTGHVWDWDNAGEEVQQRFIKHVIDGTRPLAKEDC